MPKPTDPSKHAYMFSDDMKFIQKVIIFHPTDNKFLTLKRHAASHTRPNDWDLPGGNVLYGQKNDESLLSEIKEETALEVTDIKPLQVVTNYEEEKNIYYLFIGFAAKAISTNVTLSHEHSEYKWVDKTEFLSLVQAQYLKDLTNYL